MTRKTKTTTDRLRDLIGGDVAVELQDHALGGDGPMLFIAYGRLADVTGDELLVDFWRYADPTHARDANTETARIVLGAVKRVWPLTRCAPVKVEVVV